MKKYLLLRDNRPSGPHSLEELTAMTLRPTDLIWVEEESRSWQPADARAELADHVKEESFEEREARRQQWMSRSPRPLPEQEAAASLDPSLFPERLRPAPTKKVPIWKTQLMKPSSGALNMLAIGVLLAFGAVMMKKMVDSFTEGPNGDLPVAFAFQDERQYAAKNMQHALQRETLPSTEQLEQLPPPRSDRPKDIQQQIRIKSLYPAANDSSSVAELQVYNGSPHLVEKLTMSLDFVESDSLVSTRKYVLAQLKAFGSKKLRVPLDRPGIRVKPHVVRVYSHEYKEALKNL